MRKEMFALGEEKKDPQPPQPPQLDRKFQLHPYQYIAIPLLFLMPVLALLGVFGETVTTKTGSNEDLTVRVEYTSRIRYKMLAPLTVYITNRTDTPLETLTVRFDRAYIEGFSQVTFTPQAQTVDEDAYVVELQDVQPGETRVVEGDLQAEKYGEYKGSVMVSADGVDSVDVMLEAFLFP
jgi:hypothetical protein